MAEIRFTKSFKQNLTNNLNDWFEENNLPYQAKTEYHMAIPSGRNMVDIAITTKDNSYINKVVGIELEVKSSQEQIFKNKKKFNDWVCQSNDRMGGLLHLIFSRANITQPKMYRLLKDGYAAVSEGNDFYYEFMAINPDDYRQSSELARSLVHDNWEFDARLWALIDQVFET